MRFSYVVPPVFSTAIAVCRHFTKTSCVGQGRRSARLDGLELRSRLLPVGGVAVDFELERANLPVRLGEVGVGLRVEKFRARLVKRLLEFVYLLLGRLDALLEFPQFRRDFRAFRRALLPELLL
jgi:hypothetical protein